VLVTAATITSLMAALLSDLVSQYVAGVTDRVSAAVFA
jgi:hypothetical protein